MEKILAIGLTSHAATSPRCKEGTAARPDFAQETERQTARRQGAPRSLSRAMPDAHDPRPDRRQMDGSRAGIAQRESAALQSASPRDRRPDAENAVANAEGAGARWDGVAKS